MDKTLYMLIEDTLAKYQVAYKEEDLIFLSWATTESINRLKVYIDTGSKYNYACANTLDSVIEKYITRFTFEGEYTHMYLWDELTKLVKVE